MDIQTTPSVTPKAHEALAFISDELQVEGSDATLLSKEELGRADYQVAKLYYDKADLDNAEKFFIKALKFTERPRDTFTIFKILGFLVRIASEKLETQKAEIYIKQAEDIVAEMTSFLGTLNSEYFYNVGIVRNYSGDFENAKENFEICYRKAKEENEPDLLAKCLLALAINGFNRSDFDYSLLYLQKLEQLLKIIKKSYLLGAMYLFSAKVYLELGQFERSISDFSLANKTLQSKKCWNLIGYTLLGNGKVYKQKGDFATALVYFKMARDLVDQNVFKRLSTLIISEIEEVNDSSVDIYLDRINRKVKERTLGIIDFKHRFVLLEILFLLAKNPGEFFDKEKLAKSIWMDEYNPLIHDKLIYTSVSRLRKLIEPKNDKGQKRKYIVRGKDGYTFDPDVKIRFHMESKVVSDKIIGNVEIGSPV